MKIPIISIICILLLFGCTGDDDISKIHTGTVASTKTIQTVGTLVYVEESIPSPSTRMKDGAEGSILVFVRTPIVTGMDVNKPLAEIKIQKWNETYLETPLGFDALLIVNATGAYPLMVAVPPQPNARLRLDVDIMPSADIKLIGKDGLTVLQNNTNISQNSEEQYLKLEIMENRARGILKPAVGIRLTYLNGSDASWDVRPDLQSEGGAQFSPRSAGLPFSGYQYAWDFSKDALVDYRSKYITMNLQTRDVKDIVRMDIQVADLATYIQGNHVYEGLCDENGNDVGMQNVVETFYLIPKNESKQVKE